MQTCCAQKAAITDVAPAQAKKLAAKGAVFVDIRTAANFEKEHLPDAVNVPLFVPVAGQEAFDKIKRFVMATAFAMTATGAPADDCCKALPRAMPPLPSYKQTGTFMVSTARIIALRTQWVRNAHRCTPTCKNVSKNISFCATPVTNHVAARRAQQAVCGGRAGSAEARPAGDRVLQPRRHAHDGRRRPTRQV